MTKTEDLRFTIREYLGIELPEPDIKYINDLTHEILKILKDKGLVFLADGTVDYGGITEKLEV